ncbi:hypothetical protein BU15DRAFT_65933 [Melanogaster broomeanus]|nr:hypothetical protein BU15DRAFT_65933 [Melanogaster broomeanus]
MKPFGSRFYRQDKLLSSGYYDRFAEESTALTSSFIASPPPSLTALHGRSDIPYFKFTSQGEILSGPHRSAAGLISPLNPMDPGVEMPSWDELLCTTEGYLSATTCTKGAHDGMAVQGNDCLTTHQPLGISRSDTASRLNASDVAPNFYCSFSDPLAALGVGSSSLPTNCQGTFGTEPLQEHLCTIDKVTSPVLRASAPSTTSSTYESGSHLWNVDQTREMLTTGPLHASSVLPPFAITVLRALAALASESNFRMTVKQSSQNAALSLTRTAVIPGPMLLTTLIWTSPLCPHYGHIAIISSDSLSI